MQAESEVYRISRTKNIYIYKVIRGAQIRSVLQVGEGSFNSVYDESVTDNLIIIIPWLKLSLKKNTHYYTIGLNP